MRPKQPAAAEAVTARICPADCTGRHSGWHAWRVRAETGRECAACPLGTPFCSPWNAAEIRTQPFLRSLPPERRPARPRATPRLRAACAG